VYDLGTGNDQLTLADGANTLTVGGIESIVGGTGADTLTLSAAQTSGTFDLAQVLTASTCSTRTTPVSLGNVETIVGNSGDDLITLTYRDFRRLRQPGCRRRRTDPGQLQQQPVH